MLKDRQLFFMTIDGVGVMESEDTRPRPPPMSPRSVLRQNIKEGEENVRTISFK